MVFVDAAGQAENRSSRILIPVRCAKAGKRRHDIASVRVVHFLRHIFGIGRGFNQLHLIAQPLDCGSADENGSLKRIRDLVPDAPCNRGNKTVCRRNRLFSRVHQQEAARSVCIFRFARRIAGLAEQRRLLVSRCSRDRDRAAEICRCRLPVDTARRADFRQHTERNVQLF